MLASLGVDSQRPEEIIARLTGGKHEYEGRVEVRYQGKWKAVCDHGWGLEEAKAACRMVGYPGAERFTTGYVRPPITEQCGRLL